MEDSSQSPFLVPACLCLVFFTECLLKRDAKWLLQKWDLHWKARLLLFFILPAISDPNQTTMRGLGGSSLSAAICSLQHFASMFNLE